MESLTVMQTYHTKSMHRGNTKSMMNLQGYNENEVELDPGFVKKRVSDYISSSNRELSSSGKEKDFYFVSRDKWEPLTPFNPKFRDVSLQPAETYPKVAMATQLRSAQQKAFIGRVPDAQAPPESHPQTYSTSQVVSFSRVQMPERHFASTVELGGKYCDENTNSHPQRQGQLVSPTSGHPVYRAIPRMAASPTPSEKREPPTPPQRGDSRNRTHQMQSEHMKSSSWPVTVTETQESKRNDNNCTPSSIISPTDIPPVKLCPEPEQMRPNHRKMYSMTGDSEHSTYSAEPPQSTKSPTMYSSQLHVTREPTTGSETFPRMSSKKQENIFTAQPCYVDPESEGTETDTSSWYQTSSPQHIPEKHLSSQEYQPRGSPPTRDNVDKITEEKDPLVSAFQSYMQTVLDQEESLQGINPESSSTGSESPTHQPHSYFPANRLHSQTLPAYVARNENEKRLSRTSVSSLESHSSSNNRVKSPTSRLSSDEEEQNRKNSQLGNGNKRNWKSPNDFSTKKPVIDTTKKWEEVVLIADPTWGEKYPQPEASLTQENPDELRSSKQINEKLIRGNAPGMRSPISPLMMEAVTTIEPQRTEKITETQQKEIQFLKAEGRDSGYEVDAENPFRSQQDSPDHISDVAKTFSSEDLMKLDKVDSTGGISILSQLQKEKPFNQRYPINGEPSMKTTVNHETKVEIRIDRPYSSPTNESSRQYSRSEMTRPQSSRPQPVYQPKSKEDFLKEMKSQPQNAKNSSFGSQPQLSRQTGSDTSSRHYHSSSLDLDTRVSGPQVQSSFPPWRTEGSEEPSTTVSHSRSHSYSGSHYSGYPGPSEPRFSRIDEEQTESGPTPQYGNNQDQRMGSSLPRSYGSQDRDAKDHRRSTSDLKNPEPPLRKTSFERGKGLRGDLDYASQHQYSKSDSERHRRYSPADQCHNISDPSGAIRKSHRVSDPEDKRNIKDALMNFFHTKTGPQRSEGSVFGSQQGSLSDYASMQSLDQFSQYSSMSSLHGRRGGGMDSFDHSRQSSYSSNASHAHRDSGIVSPSESSWGPPSPNTSPPGVMDHRQRGQQRLPATDHNHQRTSSDSTSASERIQDSNFHRNSFSGLDDARLGKKSSKVSRSSSMSHASRRRPVSFHDPRDRYMHKDDFSKGLSRTETFSMGQRPSASHNRQSSQLSATLPSTGYPDNNGKPHWSSKESNLRGPVKAAPSVDKSSSCQEPEADDIPPELPPKQVKEAQLKTITKVDQRQPEERSEYKAQGDRKASSPPAQTVFNFPSPTHADQPRHPSPKTSPTLPVKDTSPAAQSVNRPRSRTSPSLPSGQETSSPTSQRSAEPHRRSSSSPGVASTRGTSSPTHQKSADPQRRSSTSLPTGKETSPTAHQRGADPQRRPETSPSLPIGQESASPTHPRRSSPPLPSSKETSPTHPISISPRARSRTDSFDLPPPPTPPAFPITEDLDVGSDLPPPPLEVLQHYPQFHREDKKAVEEPISHRQAVSTQAAVSHLQADQEYNAEWVSSSVSPQTSSQQSPANTAQDRLPVPANLTVQPRSEREGVIPAKEGPVVDLIKDSGVDIIDGGNVSDTPSSQSGINGSPISRRLALDLEADDEAGPIQVVEIIRTPTLSPKRGHEEQHSLDPLVDWVLQSVNSQDIALRELFHFPEEPEKVGSPGYKKMPHGKKGEVQTPKRPECDVKSLTHALSSSLYLQISPAKALLLTKAKGMMGSDVVHSDSQELRKTKEELISRITRKVSELRKEKQELQEEINNIEDLGRQVTETVRESCKESSLDKYVMYIGDADRVTKLLLSLNRRLTKVKSVLNSLEGNDDEEQKADLQKMHKDLNSKYEDAKGLKSSIDGRHVQISSMLQDHLSAEEHEDFCHFVRMRSRLRIMAQELDDRITLGEEQLEALRDSMKDESSQAEGSQGQMSVCSYDSS